MIFYERAGSVSILRVFAQVDMANSVILRKALSHIDGEAAGIVDLTRCSYLDSTALSVLFQTSKRHALVLVVRPGSIVQRILHIANLESVFTIVSSQEDAIRQATTLGT